ncbi:MAG TPA: enoyl-CoA hydratase-related protein [Candidatus Limnocylindrales bacterium]
MSSSPQTPTPLRVERAGPDGVVARVVLARPERRNALDAATIAALGETFWSLADEPASSLRVVVLAGEGRAFCAGADIAWMRAAMALSREENVEDALGLADTLAAIDACPVPVVVRVQGAALGGGAGLCAVGDVVVAEAGAKFGFPEVRLGLVGATIAPFVVRRIGEGATRALFATGERIDAAKAQRIGLVHHVADGEAALDTAVDGVVADILAGGPEAVRAAKALAREVAAAAWGGPEAMARLGVRTAEILAARRASAEAAEGLAAFDGRRRPAWAPPDAPE